MTTHLHSSTPLTSRAVFPGSLGAAGGSLYSDVNYSLFHNGFAVVSSPFINPLGFYLAPVPSDNQNNVDVWIHSQPYHGVPLIQVSQTSGFFTRNFTDTVDMPQSGFIKMDMYANTLTQIYRNTYNVATP